jgi:hypothetical protein
MIEITEDDTFVNLFFKSVSKEDYHTLWIWGEYDDCVKRSVIYDWWYNYLKDNVKSKFFRNTLNDAMRDEDVYAMLVNIHETYKTHIKNIYKKTE